MELRPPANFAPSFGVQDEDAAVDGVQVTRTVKETVKVGSSVGAPVAATDADNDPLLYSLADYDDPMQLGIDLNGDGDFDDTGISEADTAVDLNGDGDTNDSVDEADVSVDLNGDGIVDDEDRDINGDGDTDDTGISEANAAIDLNGDGDTDDTGFVEAEVDDSRWFKIDLKTGQISVKTPTDQAAVTAVLEQDKESPTEEFKIMVTATDPSGAPVVVMVTIEVEAVDEAPGIKAATDLDDDLDITAITDPFNVKTKEEVQLDPRGIGTDADLVDTLPIFEATDPEGMVAGAGLEDERIKWSVSGPDAKRFEIVKLPDTHNNVEPGDAQEDGAAGVDADPDANPPVEGVGGYFVDGNGVTVAGVVDGDPVAGLTDDPQTVFDLRLDGKVKGALRFTKPYPSFEDMDSADGDNVYVVEVRVTDGKTNSSKTVTVTVENVPEPGTVALSQRRPQEGIPITARLTDKDDGVSGTEWQWYRGPGRELATKGKLLDTDDDGEFDGIDRDFDGDLNGYDLNGDGNVDEGDDDAADLNGDGDTLDTVTIDGTDVVEAEAGEQWLERFTEVADSTSPLVVTTYSIAECEAGTASTRTCFIDNATSSTYIPVAADADSKLHARAVYKDTLGDDSAVKTSEQDSVVRPNANARPRFLDKGPVERDVVENVKDASVGDPVAATDTDPLIYTLSGDDAASFKIDNSGQIQTKVKLDYETKPSYTVTVTATDPSLSSASTTVNITVTDEDDGATVTLLTGNAPAFAAEEMTRSVAENTAAGTAIGEPVAATDEDGDALTYTLWGDDAGSFGIDPATGQLMTSAALDYETKMSYTVTVTASSGKADEVDAMTTVTINVTDEGLDNAYDLNEDGTIERDEVIAAIQDYLAGNIERSEVTALIRLYYANGG